MNSTYNSLVETYSRTEDYYLKVRRTTAITGPRRVIVHVKTSISRLRWIAWLAALSSPHAPRHLRYRSVPRPMATGGDGALTFNGWLRQIALP